MKNDNNVTGQIGDEDIAMRLLGNTPEDRAFANEISEEGNANFLNEDSVLRLRLVEVDEGITLRDPNESGIFSDALNDAGISLENSEDREPFFHSPIDGDDVVFEGRYDGDLGEFDPENAFEGIPLLYEDANLSFSGDDSGISLRHRSDKPRVVESSERNLFPAPQCESPPSVQSRFEGLPANCSISPFPESNVIDAAIQDADEDGFSVSNGVKVIEPRPGDGLLKNVFRKAPVEDMEESLSEVTPVDEATLHKFEQEDEAPVVANEGSFEKVAEPVHKREGRFFTEEELRRELKEVIELCLKFAREEKGLPVVQPCKDNTISIDISSDPQTLEKPHPVRKAASFLGLVFCAACMYRSVEHTSAKVQRGEISKDPITVLKCFALNSFENAGKGVGSSLNALKYGFVSGLEEPRPN